MLFTVKTRYCKNGLQDGCVAIVPCEFRHEKSPHDDRPIREKVHEIIAEHKQDQSFEKAG